MVHQEEIMIGVLVGKVVAMVLNHFMKMMTILFLKKVVNLYILYVPQVLHNVHVVARVMLIADMVVNHM